MRPIPELNEGRLYDLLEQQGEQARACAHLLAQGTEEGTLDPAAVTELARTSTVAAEEISAHLLRVHMISLSKADVEALASTLAAIPADATKFADRLQLAGKEVPGFGFRPPLTWVEELGEIVLDMVRQLRGFESLNRVAELNVRLLRVADEAETLTGQIISQDFTHPATALHSMIVKGLCDQLDVIIDRYREAGVIMTRIASGFF